MVTSKTEESPEYSIAKSPADPVIAIHCSIRESLTEDRITQAIVQENYTLSAPIACAYLRPLESPKYLTAVRSFLQ